jgi:hypothetical protein
MSRFANWIATTWRRYVRNEPGAFRFQPGDYFHFDTGAHFFITDGAEGWFIFPGGKVLEPGHYHEGYKVYRVTFDPKGELSGDGIRKAEVLAYEHSMRGPIDQRHFETLTVDATEGWKVVTVWDLKRRNSERRNAAS